MTVDILAALAYGTIAVIGGIVGYIRANSKISLVSGSFCGLLLIFAAVMQLQGQTWGLLLAAAVTAGLAGLLVFFAFRLAKTRKFLPAGLMTVLGMLALAVMVHALAAKK